MTSRRPHLHRRIHLRLGDADMSNLHRLPADPPAERGRERPLRRGVHRGAALALLCACGLVPTTVLDLTGSAPRLQRKGLGDVSALGLDEA